MENSVGTTIEKIKHQEQDKEAKLKEKRQLEGTVIALNRAIRDAMSQADKAKNDILELEKVTKKLQTQIDDSDVCRSALVAQLDACNKELSELKAQSDLGVSTVWELRTTMCEMVHNIANECDAWALLMKPMCSEISNRPVKKRSKDNANALIKERLKTAIERRDKALAERNRLLSEPESGDEFIRIKNAVYYSKKITENMQEGINK